MIKFYFVIILILFIYLSIEYILLSISTKKIPLRILINGTRGKSTTVKLIYNILRKNGLNTYAKITGDNPILFYPDGTEKKLKRFAPTSIKENIKLLKQISKEKPNAIVMECMALHSETQSMLGKLIFKPHYVLIVNVLPDHKEVMGETIEQNLLTMLECVNKESTLLLTNEINSILQNVNYFHNKTIIIEQVEFNFNFSNIPEEIINESWSVIKEISKQLNIDEQIAKDEFISEWKTINEKIKFEILKSNIDIWNLFSINDIITTKKFILLSLKLKPKNGIIFILNSRIDRPFRTKEFVEYIIDNFPHSEVWLMGNGKQLAKTIFTKKHFQKSNILLVNDEQAITKIRNTVSQNTSLYCIGNHKETEHLENKLKRLSFSKGVQ